MDLVFQKLKLYIQSHYLNIKNELIYILHIKNVLKLYWRNLDLCDCFVENALSEGTVADPVNEGKKFSWLMQLVKSMM